MKYMLLMQFSSESGIAPMDAWSPEDVKAHIEFMHDLNRGLVEAGELVDAQGLAMPGQARIVRAGEGGVPVVTDGPFPETKEFLIGYWIVDCEGPERAYELAARISAAPGLNGEPLSMPIEVRQVMAAPSQEL
ncbi:YciI family protein [Microbispora bryophytorum]|uniref:YCII-related domain-containing protein n=1 Tax=Microbispora bryophytorum subsp. camponoti TaxID=1677852 RepID=A0ABR8KY41_9ACTN|nr:YciI family protein [Microbispora camponoti]MBD3143684.1 hypothetical protein [Microbispora camponoti]